MVSNPGQIPTKKEPSGNPLEKVKVFPKKLGFPKVVEIFYKVPYLGNWKKEPELGLTNPFWKTKSKFPFQKRRKFFPGFPTNSL